MRRRRASGDRGDVVVEMVLLTPLIALIVFTVIQCALWYHARHVVTAAAQEAARAARVATTDPSAAEIAGAERGHAYIDILGGQVVSNPDIDVDRTVDTVTVDISADVVHIIPGLTLSVSGHAVSPVEVFLAP